MKIYINSNYEIEKLDGYTKLALGNDNFDRIELVIDNGLVDDGTNTMAPSFSFKLANGRLMGDYSPNTITTEGNATTFTYLVSEVILSVKGPLQCTINFNFFKNTVCFKKKCISVTFQVTNNVVINDELYYTGEDVSTSLFAFKNNILSNTAELASLAIKTNKTLSFGRKLFSTTENGIYASFQNACSDVFELFAVSDSSDTCSLKCLDSTLGSEVATLVFISSSNYVGMYNSSDNNYYKISQDEDNNYVLDPLFVRNDEIQTKYIAPSEALTKQYIDTNVKRLEDDITFNRVGLLKAGEYNPETGVIELIYDETIVDNLDYDSATGIVTITY